MLQEAIESLTEKYEDRFQEEEESDDEWGVTTSIFPLVGKTQLRQVCFRNVDCAAGLFCSSCVADGDLLPRCHRYKTTNVTDIRRSTIQQVCLANDSNSFAKVGASSHTGEPIVTLENQEDSILDQLDNGVRGLMLDMYDFLGDVWLCHSFGGTCYNFTAFVSSCSFEIWNTSIEGFLSANPTEIVTIFIEEYVRSPNGLTKVFQAAGLKKYWFPVSRMPKNGENWPTITEMVAKNQRLLVFTSNRTKEAVVYICISKQTLHCITAKCCIELFVWKWRNENRGMPKERGIGDVECDEQVAGGKVQQQLNAYGILPPSQQERDPEKSHGETSKRGLSTEKGVENAYQELKQLLEGKPSSKKKCHAPHGGSPSKEREERESQNESMEDVAPRRRRAQRSPTPPKRKKSLHSHHRRKSRREEKSSRKKKERKRSPSSPSSLPSSSFEESSEYSSQEKQRRGHQRSYATWKRSSKLKKFKEGGKNVSFLTYDGTFGATNKVLAFIQQFDAAFGDEGFTESSKLHHIAGALLQRE
ncbi:hypothetical protein L7F22_010865 [Adiantum nelumboides]|nr:hypothetical protein [Adiantum nelumboides]